MDAIEGKYGCGKRHDGEQGSLFWFAVPYRPDEITASLFQPNNLTTSDPLSSFVVPNLSVVIQPHPDLSTHNVPRVGPYNLNVTPTHAVGSGSGPSSNGTSPSHHMFLMNSYKRRSERHLLQAQSSTNSLENGTHAPQHRSTALVHPLSILHSGEHGNNVLVGVEGGGDRILLTSSKRGLSVVSSHELENGLDSSWSSTLNLSKPHPDTTQVQSISKSNNSIAAPMMKKIFSPTQEYPLKDSGGSSKHMKSAESSEKEKQSVKQKCILIVDDAPTIVKMIAMMLKRQGYLTEIAENGEIALEKLIDAATGKHSRYDLVLMDLQMPIMDGLEATRRYRVFEESHKTDIPAHHQVIIGMSANSDAETTQEALQAGIDDFIGKPFSVDFFQQTIRKHFVS
jgi:CheY-like chemotaxis protein